VIWQRLDQMTSHTLQAPPSCVTEKLTDRLTDLQTETAIIGNNSLHFMHPMQPNNCWNASNKFILVTIVNNICHTVTQNAAQYGTLP